MADSNDSDRPAPPSPPTPPAPPAIPAPPELPDPPAPPPPPEPPAAAAPRRRKDRLVQTRVPRDLEDRIKEEAGRRRVTVSQLVRNLLEDAVDLVDNVLDSVDDIVSDSVDFAENVGRDFAAVGGRRRRAARRRDDDADSEREDEASSRAPGLDALDHVAAWNPVILNRDVDCSGCGRALDRGDDAYAGLGSGPISWLCDRCMEALQD